MKDAGIFEAGCFDNIDSTVISRSQGKVKLNEL